MANPTPIWTRVGGARRFRRLSGGYEAARDRAERALTLDLSVSPYGHRHPGPADEPCPDCPGGAR